MLKFTIINIYDKKTVRQVADGIKKNQFGGYFIMAIRWLDTVAPFTSNNKMYVPEFNP